MRLDDHCFSSRPTPRGRGGLGDSAMASVARGGHNGRRLTPDDANDQRVADSDDDGRDNEDGKRYQRDVHLRTRTPVGAIFHSLDTTVGAFRHAILNKRCAFLN